MIPQFAQSATDEPAFRTRFLTVTRNLQLNIDWIHVPIPFSSHASWKLWKLTRVILCFCHCKIRYWCRTGCRVHKSGTPFPRPYLAGVTFGNLHVFKHRPSWVSIKHRLEPTHSSTNVCRNHVLLLCNYFFSRETSTPLPASESKFRGGAGLRVKLHIEEVIHGRPFHSKKVLPARVLPRQCPWNVGFLPRNGIVRSASYPRGPAKSAPLTSAIANVRSIMPSLCEPSLIRRWPAIRSRDRCGKPIGEWTGKWNCYLFSGKNFSDDRFLDPW